MAKKHPLIRPLVQELHAYVPGEQPKIKGLIKLNTNENPFPPSPKVLRVVKNAVDGRLRLYPNPTAEKLREKIAKLHQCKPENVIVGNGSDEVLALAVRAFVENSWSREDKFMTPPTHKVQYFAPSYSLYPVLADIHGAAKNAVDLNSDFSMPSVGTLKSNTEFNWQQHLKWHREWRRGNPNLATIGRERKPQANWDFNAALTFITTPNAPSGHGYKTSELEKLCRAQKGVVVLDEAYVDFAKENAMSLALKLPHVLVARTFSKAYSLCFQRVGYLVGNAELISALHKIRDSYNVNGLGQIAAEATLDDLKYYRVNFKKIIATRAWLSRELTKLGFRVLPSQTNFILTEPPKFPAEDWLQKLRAKKILVRWFSSPGIDKFLRITIGTRTEAAALVKAARQILKQ
jgi:histidinol-phosphate aminotransferase